MGQIPFLYKAFCLWIEPVATLVGAYYAWFQPQTYLQLLHAPSAPGILGVPVATETLSRALGNMYFAFVLNEALVLRATSDLKVWRTLLFGLLVADLGHLYSCLPLGIERYYDIANWNSIDYGNFLFVYCGAATRICFLIGIGMGGSKKAKSKAKKSINSLPGSEFAGESPSAPASSSPNSKPAPVQNIKKKSKRSS